MRSPRMMIATGPEVPLVAGEILSPGFIFAEGVWMGVDTADRRRGRERDRDRDRGDLRVR